MDKIIIIVKHILKRMIKKPITFMLLFFVPIVISIALFFVFNLDFDKTTSIAVVDLDESEISRVLIDSLEGIDGITVEKVEEEYLEYHISNKHYDVGYTIPSKFQLNLKNEKTPVVEIFSTMNENELGWISRKTDFTIESIKAALLLETTSDLDFIEILDNMNRGAVKFESEYVVDRSKEKNATVRSFGIYLLFLLMSTFVVSFKILDEKIKGTFTRIGIAQVHPKIYIIANIITNLFISMLQIAVVIIVLTFVVKTNFYANPLIIYLIIVTFSLCTISLGVLFAAVSSNMNNALALMGLTAAPTALIAGSFWSIDLVPEFMRKLAYITPQRWTLDAIELVQRNNNVIEILPNLLILIGYSSLFFLLATYKFNNEERGI